MPNNSTSDQRNKTPDDTAGPDERPGLSPEEARALAHPSRRRITEALGAAAGGMTVAELAGAVELHPNAVRQHLEVLQRVGVVVKAPSPPTGRRQRSRRQGGRQAGSR